MKKQIFTLFAVLISVLSLAQNNWYVSNTGNDSNDGSSGSPWQTIQYAVTQLSPGDTLNIMAGSYTGKIDLSVSGTSGQRITIRNHNNDNAIIDGSSLNDFDYLLKIENVDYVNVIGLKFQDYQKLYSKGVFIVNSSHISILNNEFSNIDYAVNALGEVPNSNQNSQPIIAFGQDPQEPITNLKINGNSIHDCEVGFSECLSVNGNIDGFEILNNHIFNNTNIGIDAIGFEGECPDPQFDQARNGLIKNNLVHNNSSPYAAAAGIYVDCGRSIIVENNTSYNNDYGIEVGCENNASVSGDPSASDVMVRNNLIYNNKVTGIALGGYNYPSTGKVETTTIRNNTCFGNDTNNSYNGEMFISYVETSSIENNIFYANNNDKVLFITNKPNPTLSLNYNLYYTPSGANDMAIEIDGTGYYEFSTYQAGASQDANSIFANPQFMDESLPNPDLHINTSSPAKNAGNPSFTAGADEKDIDGDARIQEGRVDMGADEYGITLPVVYLAPLQLTAHSDHIELKWLTAIESNHSKFIIQRSANAIDWKDIKTVYEENRSSSNTKFYQALDFKPITGISYYRLQQIDWDGNFDYSDIASVSWDKSWSQIAISPNPAHYETEISFHNPHSNKFTCKVFDAKGNLVFQKDKIITEFIKLNVANWEVGNYLLQLIAENGRMKNVSFIITR